MGKGSKCVKNIIKKEGFNMKNNNDIVGVTKKIFLTVLLSFTILTTFKVNTYAETVQNNAPNSVSKKIYTVYEGDNFLFQDKNSEYKEMHNLKKDLFTAFNIKIDTKEFLLNNENLGVVSMETTIENILSEVAEKYIQENGLNHELIKTIEIETNAKLIDTKNTIDKIQPNECIVDKIFEEINKDSLLNIKVIKEIDETVKINPGTEIIPDDSLYYGQNKVVQGESGEKIIVKEETYINGEKKSDKKISEQIVKEAKNKIIYKGSKNPYNDGIAFLSHPTRGGVMTSGYGERWNAFHKGIDIAGNIGDTVSAAIDGKVIYAQYNDGGYGNLIILEHADNMLTYYAHLSHIGAEVGEQVTKGDKIGEVGNTGFSTGPHLHFELRVNNNPVDPSKYIL